MRRTSPLLAGLLVVVASCDMVASSNASPSPGKSIRNCDAQGATTDLPVVFPLPPGNVSEMTPCTVRDDEFAHIEDATFLITGTDLDAVVSFYQEVLPSLGYELGEPMQLGASKAISVRNPDNPNVSAVVQAGPVSPTDPTIQLHQERTEYKD